jgi:TRAP-type C4-dicarboxylate transport system permease large subunit
MSHLIKALASTPAERWTIDWLAIWALFLGVVALSVASYVYFADEAPVAAAFVLVAYAAIIGVVLRETTQRQ